MNRSLPVGVVAGALVATVVHVALLPNWYFAFTTGLTYAGVAYFAHAHRGVAFRLRTNFATRTDRAGFFLGSLGSTLGILAIVDYLDVPFHVGAAFVVWYTGALAFYRFETHVRHDASA